MVRAIMVTHIAIMTLMMIQAKAWDTNHHFQLAMFRPKVDEISLLTLNGTQFNPGHQPQPNEKHLEDPAQQFDNQSHECAVLEFQKGTLQNLYWKKFGCASCTGKSLVCLNHTDSAIPTSNCIGNGGAVDCNLGIQLAFSGTNKNEEVLNSWYEVANLRQYSLLALYSNLRKTLTGPFSNLF
ncbi:unnamed protein product [Camellia sinensis]